MQLLISSKIPVPHGFATREGGASAKPFDSLNVGLSVGDDAQVVASNMELIAQTLGIRASSLLTVSQVHSDKVFHAHESPRGEMLAAPVAEADALWTSTPDLAVAVKTADCIPLLLVDHRVRRVAAVHAGWKGTLNKIAARQLEAWPDHQARVAIGPCIRVCCYEVSDDLARQFTQVFGPEVVELRAGRAHLNLPLAMRLTLQESGVVADHIDDLELCTHCDTRFFSHRRERGLTGRQLSLIACRF